MKSIIFENVRISGSQLKCSSLENEKGFLNFLFILLNLGQFLNISKNKWSLQPMYLRNLRRPRMWVD